MKFFDNNVRLNDLGLELCFLRVDNLITYFLNLKSNYYILKISSLVLNETILIECVLKIKFKFLKYVINLNVLLLRNKTHKYVLKIVKSFKKV